MGPFQLAGAFCVAVAAGVGVGLLARGEARGGPGRPEPVEAALRSFEKGDEPARVREALAKAGLPESHGSPWRDELKFVRAAVDRDWDALARLGYDGPRGPLAARALLFVSERHPDAAEKARAFDRMRRDYPASWAVAARDRGGR